MSIRFSPCDCCGVNCCNELPTTLYARIRFVGNTGGVQFQRCYRVSSYTYSAGEPVATLTFNGTKYVGSVLVGYTGCTKLVEIELTCTDPIVPGGHCIGGTIKLTYDGEIFMGTSFSFGCDLCTNNQATIFNITKAFTINHGNDYCNINDTVIVTVYNYAVTSGIPICVPNPDTACYNWTIVSNNTNIDGLTIKLIHSAIDPNVCLPNSIQWWVDCDPGPITNFCLNQFGPLCLASTLTPGLLAIKFFDSLLDNPCSTNFTFATVVNCCPLLATVAGFFVDCCGNNYTLGGSITE